MTEQDKMNRRNLLKAGAAVATTFFASNLVSGAEEKTWWKNGAIQAKDFSPLVSHPPAGMSSRQVNEHLGLYRKYVASLNKINETEKTTGISHDTLINKGFAYGGTLLHELYFSNLSSNPPQLNYQSELMRAIERDFGAYEGLINNLKEAGKVARGWVVLGLCLSNGRLVINGLDSHNEGSALVFSWPIIVMDVYEHAYMIDHGTNKEAYLDSFLKDIDWSIAEARFQQGVKTISQSVLII